MTSGDFGRPPLAPLAREDAVLAGVFALPSCDMTFCRGVFLGVFMAWYVVRVVDLERFITHDVRDVVQRVQYGLCYASGFG